MGGWIPPTVPVALALLVINMIGWGSWANTMKGTDGWRFESYYLTYAIGLFIFALLYQVTLGLIPNSLTGLTSFQALSEATPIHIFWALLAGIVWNAGNILLVAAIAMAGFSLAFPVGIGLSLVIGAVLSYIVRPYGVAWLEFGGLALIMLAIIVDALAYNIKGKASGEVRQAQYIRRGLILSIILGILIGVFDPLFALSITGAHAIDSYSAATFLTLGAMVSSFVFIPIFMKKPLTPGQEPTSLSNWIKGKASWHMWALLGGFVWSTATVMNFISSPVAGVTISYILGQNATMISAIWGVFVWKELKGAPRTAWYLIGLMFVLFIVGIIMVALASLLAK
ncbi:MAG: GRP family sugar transporter [Nitrososphaeria archaeon]